MNENYFETLCCPCDTSYISDLEKSEVCALTSVPCFSASEDWIYGIEIEKPNTTDTTPHSPLGLVGSTLKNTEIILFFSEFIGDKTKGSLSPHFHPISPFPPFSCYCSDTWGWVYISEELLRESYTKGRTSCKSEDFQGYAVFHWKPLLPGIHALRQGFDLLENRHYAIQTDGQKRSQSGDHVCTSSMDDEGMILSWEHLNNCSFRAYAPVTESNVSPLIKLGVQCPLGKALQCKVDMIT